MSPDRDSPPGGGPVMKLPTRVEWDNEAVGVFVDDDEETLLMTSQDGVREQGSIGFSN